MLFPAAVLNLSTHCRAPACRIAATLLGLALASFGGVTAAHAADAAHAPHAPAGHAHAAHAALDPADPINVLVRDSEQALVRGDSIAAQAGFERAAATRHAAQIEMGLVRASMQAGAYREALGFCAHAAGGHLDEPAASALYAWLLRVGAQDAVAERVLSDALRRAPLDAVALATRAAFDAGLVAPPSGVLLALPHRLAPQPHPLAGQAAPLPGTRSVSAGVLLDGGRLALVPLTALLPRTTPATPATPATPVAQPRLWLRNGLGQTTEAVADAAAQAPFVPLGLLLLRLLEPLPLPVSVSASPASDATRAAASQLAPRDAFAGSSGYALAYPGSADAAAAWPTLHAGFLGGAAPQPGSRQLGFAVPSGPLGGPVFDAAGRVAGIALGSTAAPGSTAQATLLPVSMWRAAVAAALAGAVPAAPAAGAVVEAAPTARMAADEVYERGLKIALQLLVGP